MSSTTPDKRLDPRIGAHALVATLEVLAALARVGRWVTVYYGWRPNLPDEGDNHLIELAAAGNAQAIVTYNVRDLTRGELTWPRLSILTPAQYLEQQP
ncbi:MAG: PIN domain-containing protein [Burkholderiaceae bacterium]